MFSRPTIASNAAIRGSPKNRFTAGSCLNGNVSHDAIDGLAAFEKNEARNSGDLVFPGQVRIFVGVQFHELCAARMRCRDFLNDGRQHLAWPAPRRPKVDENRLP